MATGRLPLMPIAYFSLSTPYSAEAEALERTMAEVGLVGRILGQPDFGSWLRNVLHKPRFILAMLGIWGDSRRLLYVDADARFRAYPKLLDEIDADVAVAYHGEQLNSATIYLQDGPPVRELMRRWLAECRENPGPFGDQGPLQRVLEAMQAQGSLRVERLPESYAYIFDLSHETSPGLEPVIEQMQASRRLAR